MNGTREQIRIALYGRQGAGKTTSALIVTEVCANLGISIRRVRLAAPLYRLQSALYAEAGRHLRDEHFQNSEVLAFFATQLRQINPNALTDHAAEALAQASDGTRLVLCEDSRPVDRAALVVLGFEFVHIAAAAPLCAARRQLRGDNATCDEGPSMHVPGDRELTNNGTLRQFRDNWVDALNEILGRKEGTGAVAA